jgi:hypothetical protein
MSELEVSGFSTIEKTRDISLMITMVLRD